MGSLYRYLKEYISLFRKSRVVISDQGSISIGDQIDQRIDNREFKYGECNVEATTVDDSPIEPAILGRRNNYDRTADVPIRRPNSNASTSRSLDRIRRDNCPLRRRSIDWSAIDYSEMIAIDSCKTVPPLARLAIAGLCERLARLGRRTATTKANKCRGVGPARRRYSG